MKTNQFTDEQLIELLKSGNEKAFDELYHRFHGPLFSIAVKKLHSHDLAYELIQELFVSLWTKRSTLNIQDSVCAYLSMAVRYMVIKYFHKEQSRKKYLTHLTFSSYSSNQTEDDVNSNELSHLIDCEINKLPSKCREVFSLSRIENLSQKEIATRLHISEKTVENHITKALRVLRLNLKNILPSILALINIS